MTISRGRDTRSVIDSTVAPASTASGQPMISSAQPALAREDLQLAQCGGLDGRLVGAGGIGADEAGDEHHDQGVGPRDGT
jgi:hypothetical protein